MTADGKTLLHYYAQPNAADVAYVVPDGVETISARTFVGCASLKSITLPESLRQIGDGAFFNCDVLSSVQFGDALETIGANAFSNCDALSSVQFGDALETIGANARSKNATPCHPSGLTTGSKRSAIRRFPIATS